MAVEMHHKETVSDNEQLQTIQLFCMVQVGQGVNQLQCQGTDHGTQHEGGRRDASQQDQGELWLALAAIWKT